MSRNILRAALYERVSTEEQALKGYSIRAQRENLEEHCKNNRMKIVDHYTDEGISGSKPPLKRPDLQRLLDDVEAGKIDIILFTKLDRWFRSVKEYFKVQDILDNNGVEWRAIHENYDTTTANGQMAITIFLAVAQNERDRTAERIKAVIDSKIKNKEACWGYRSIPVGYTKMPDKDGVMRIVKDPETEEYVTEFWNILLTTNNMNKAIRYMHSNGIVRDPKSWSSLTKSDFYMGMHRGVEDFCEPYITPEQYLRYHESRNIRHTPSGRIYYFSGLIRCPRCNAVMVGQGNTNKHKKKIYKQYRCCKACRGCDYKSPWSELQLEKKLLADLDKYVENEIELAAIAARKSKSKNNANIIKNLKEQKRRLEIVYMAGNKTDDEYLREDAELRLEIEKLEKEAPEELDDLTKIKEIVGTDFRSVYKDFDEEEKRNFWQGLIKQIEISEDPKVITRVRFIS